MFFLQSLSCNPTCKSTYLLTNSSSFLNSPAAGTGLAIQYHNLLLYHETVPEVTLKPPSNSQNSYLCLHLLLHQYLYLHPL